MHPNDPFNYNPTAEPTDRPSSNGLGIAGFVVSLFGLFCCGGLSIIAIILSAFALRRQPRGFAIAGLIIGVIGLLFTALVIILVITFGGLIIFPAMMDGYKVLPEIRSYQQSHNGAMPTTWADVPNMSAGLDDTWGHPYRYTLLSDGKRVELVSNGPDGLSGTADDVTVLIDGEQVSAHIGRVPPVMQPK